MRNLVLSALACAGFCAGAFFFDSSAAQPTVSTPASASWAAGCPRLEKLRGICGFLSAREEDNSEPNYYTYAYEKNIYAAACVDFKTDTPASAKLKIRRLWSENQSSLKCYSGDFDTSGGNMLKYAVAVSNLSFLENAGPRRWGLDPNIIDDADGMTVIDYIDKRIQTRIGTPAESTLRSYRALLVSYGAKKRSELNR